MKKRKDPFVNYTTEQVFISESMLYVIQIGKEVFEDKNGQWFFVERAANRHYNKILVELMKNIYNGTSKQQKVAKKLMANFKILPLRMH